jgi:hypothetical protein
MRWPAAWKDPSTLYLLKATAIDYLLIEEGAAFEPVRAQARKLGLQIGVPDREVAGVIPVKGEWPGVKMARPGSGGVTAGPTGIPWVDSNGWQIPARVGSSPGDFGLGECRPAGKLSRVRRRVPGCHRG